MVPRSALQWPLIHPFAQQRVAGAMQGAAEPHWEQFRVKCLAQKHNDGIETNQTTNHLVLSKSNLDDKYDSISGLSILSLNCVLAQLGPCYGSQNNGGSGDPQHIE